MGALDKLIEQRRGQSSDPMQVAMLELVTRLSDKQRNELSNTEMAKGLIASLEAMQKETAKLVKSLDQSKANGDVAKALGSISKAQNAMSKQLSSLKFPETDMKPVIEAVNNLRTAIQSVSLPEPDLTPIMAEMKRMKPPKRPELKMILDKLETPEKWEFTVDRDQYSDRIESVTATKVS
jgi:hypothetical protein